MDLKLKVTKNELETQLKLNQLINGLKQMTQNRIKTNKSGLKAQLKSNLTKWA